MSSSKSRLVGAPESPTGTTSGARGPEGTGFSVQVFSAYGHRPVDPGIDCSGDECLTKQSFAAECDPNVIVARFAETGVIPAPRAGIARFADVTSVQSFGEVMELVLDAQASFLELPAEVRRRFGNDPAAFVDFCSDPANAEDMRKLGLEVPEGWGATAVAETPAKLSGAPPGSADEPGKDGKPPGAS